MRIEKTFLVREVSNRVKNSSYWYLVDFRRVTVAEIAQLRADLSKEGAYFHVVKNAILRKVGEDLKWPSFVQWLEGQTAIVYGGDNPSGVIKLLLKFAEDKEKLNAKGGFWEGQLYDVMALEALSKLPDLTTLRAMFLSLLLTPYRQCLYVMQGIPQSFLTLLEAYEKRSCVTK
ncbi:MAG: 50S ribosomal protein L10 [Puniceicoccales bacterium]|jgi:large subunit ribosomal protein L10|nr:50S ribosomal protein L10 [Puniceicoccales bacterium]